MVKYIKIGKINLKKLKEYKKMIITEDVILTTERIEHIKQRHKQEYYELENYIQYAIEEPDYILQELKHKDTIIILKEIIKDRLRIKMIIKLATNKKEHRYNSIITFWKIRERDYKKTIEKSKIIYFKN